MKYGLCIGTGPGEIKTRFAFELAQELLNNESQVEMFLFDNGIYNTLEANSLKCVSEKLKDLSEKGTSINICINMAKHRGVNKNNVAPYVEISSLISFSDLINTSDFVITTK